MSACSSLSLGRLTLLPLVPHPPLPTWYGEDPNTGSRPVISTSVLRLSLPSLDREMLAVQALETMEWGSSTVILVKGTEVSCSSSSEVEFSKNWEKVELRSQWKGSMV